MNRKRSKETKEYRNISLRELVLTIVNEILIQEDKYPDRGPQW
jgi:hypothetical protein